MPHSYTKIWLHAVFSTKEGMGLIKGGFEGKLHQYLKHRFAELGCPALALSGTEDHIHVLFLLNPQRLPAEVINTVKEESTHWVNKHELTEEEFDWQTGYGCFSVSESMVPEIVNYIQQQKEHHAKRGFEDEFSLLLKKYKIS